MNASPSASSSSRVSRPPLVCRFVRLLGSLNPTPATASAADRASESVPPTRPVHPGLAARAVARHRLKCEDCRHYFAGLAGLEQQLGQRSAQPAINPPANMDNRIMAAVRASIENGEQAQTSTRGQWTRATHRRDQGEGIRERRRARQQRAWLGFAGVAAAAALATGVWLQQRPAPRSLVATRTDAGQLSPEEVARVIDSARSWTSDTWSDLKPRATALAAANPLQTELNSVYADARSAVSFLELNFLPVAPGTDA